MKCPTCGKAEMVDTLIDETMEYSWGKDVFTVHAEAVPVRVCPNCGEQSFGIAAAVVREQAIMRVTGWKGSDGYRRYMERNRSES